MSTSLPLDFACTRYYTINKVACKWKRKAAAFSRADGKRVYIQLINPLSILNFCLSAGESDSSITSIRISDSFFVKFILRLFSSWLIFIISGSSSSTDLFLLFSLISIMILSLMGSIFDKRLL